MPDNHCPICYNIANPVFKKGATQYLKCTNCTMVYCDELSQEGLVGGCFEKERNEKENDYRVFCIDKMSEGMPKEEVRILDFGCGHGLLIEDLKRAGYVHVDGFDAYNEKFQTLPKKEYYNIIISVETIEHFSKPYVEFEVMRRSLVSYGVVFLETGFLDATREDGIKDEDNPYINPDAGHSTMYTHHALDVLMVAYGFRIKPHFNRHCLLYQKGK